jgi:ABC-2 type transport system permease protein
MNANVDMSPEMNASPVPQAIAATTASVRPFYWSVRRELWENRSIYIAPIAVAALIFVSALIHLGRLPEGAVPFYRLLEVSPHYLRLAGIGLYAIVGGILGVTAGFVGWFYCLDALYGDAIVASCSGSRCRCRMSRPC